MMVRDCMDTCYIPFLVVVVLACDPNDLFVELVTMFTAQSTELVWVGLVKYHIDFPSFIDVLGIRK
jgi:hypothetical protein